MLALLIFQDACLLAAQCAVLHYLYKDLRLLRDDTTPVFSTEEAGVTNVKPTAVETGSMMYGDSQRISRAQMPCFPEPLQASAIPSGLELPRRNLLLGSSLFTRSFSSIHSHSTERAEIQNSLEIPEQLTL